MTFVRKQTVFAIIFFMATQLDLETCVFIREVLRECEKFPVVKFSVIRVECNVSNDSGYPSEVLVKIV